PRAERLLESLRRDLDGANDERAGHLDRVAVLVARLDQHLQRLVAGVAVVVEPAGLPAEDDVAQREGLRSLFGRELRRRAAARGGNLALEGFVISVEVLALGAQ